MNEIRKKISNYTLMLGNLPLPYTSPGHPRLKPHPSIAYEMALPPVHRVLSLSILIVAVLHSPDYLQSQLEGASA